MIRVLLLSLAFGPAAAVAGEMELGVMLESGVDLPDPASATHTGFGFVPSLSVPVRIGLVEQVSLRINPRLTFASGRDRLNWEVPIDGEMVQFYSEDHDAFLAAAGLLVGPEVRVPVKESLSAHFGAMLGPSWVGTYHSLTESSQILFDLEMNDLADPGNIDPFTSQLTLSTDLFAGVSLSLSDKLFLQLEFGYAAAYVGEKVLQKAALDINPTRAAYGWNPFRAGVGVQFSL